MDRSKRTPPPRSDKRIKRINMLGNENEVNPTLICKSKRAETHHNGFAVMKQLGAVIGPPASVLVWQEQLKAEFDELAHSTVNVPTVWTPQEVKIVEHKNESGGRLEIVSPYANGRSCYDLLECTRESGQKAFSCKWLCPFLATKCLSRCVDALYNSPAYHGNVKPQNILLHFEPTTYMDESIQDLLHSEPLMSFMATKEELSLVCEVYLSDPLPPSFQTLNIRTKKQELRQSEGIMELPPFSLLELQAQKTDEERALLMTHQRRHIPPDEAQADDVWALASSIVTISTGTLLLRKENQSRVLAGTWSMQEEVEGMSERVKHAWLSLPEAVRSLLCCMLVLDWKQRPTVQELHTNEFLMSYRAALSRNKMDYYELQLCCIEAAYNASQAQKQSERLMKSFPIDTELDGKVAVALNNAARDGDVLTIQEILHVYYGRADVIDSCDNKLNRSPLMLAASRGHADCVVALLEYGASVTAHTKAHDTAVVFAIEHNHVECVEPIVRAMEEQKVVAANDRRWWTPLHFAVYHNCYNIVKMLLSNNIGGSPRTRDASGRVPREYIGMKHLACDRDPFHLKGIESKLSKLLEEYQDQRMTKEAVTLQAEQENDHLSDDEGASFLEHEMNVLSSFHEVLQSRLTTAESKLEALVLRASVLPVNHNIAAQMRLAADQGAADKLRVLLEKYHHNSHLVDTPDDGHGWTAAHIAAMRGNDVCLRILHNYGASMCLPERRGGLPLHFAVMNGHLSTVRLLLELLSPGNGDIENEEVGTDGMQMIRKSPELEELLRRGFPLKFKSGNDWTCLHHATSGDHHEIASLLMKAGASPLWTDADGRTAVDLAHSTKMSLLFEKKIAEISKSPASPSPTQTRRKSSFTFGAGETSDTLTSQRRVSSATEPADLSSSSPRSSIVYSPRGSVAEMETRPRASSSIDYVYAPDEELIAVAGYGSLQIVTPQVTDTHYEESPLTIEENRHLEHRDSVKRTRGLSVTFSELKLDGERSRQSTPAPSEPFMRPIDRATSPSASPQGLSYTPSPPPRNPSFVKRGPSPAPRTGGSFTVEGTMRHRAPPPPPPHLEGAASVERRRNSAIAVGKSSPPPPPSPGGRPSMVAPPPPQAPSTVPSAHLQSPATPSAAMTLLGSISPEDSVASIPSVSPSVASSVPIDTGDSRAGSSSRSMNTNSGNPRPIPSGERAEQKKKRPSLRMLDIAMTTKRVIPTLLNYKSEIVRTLFTEHMTKSAAPIWQQELMGMTGGGLEETKGGDGDHDNVSGLTMVSMHGLAGGISGPCASTKPLLDSIWEAAYAGNVDILSALLRQVSDGPKARHFNTVGGLQHFSLNDLRRLSIKCPNAPLYVAAKKGHQECVQLLLEAGADKEYKDKAGMTALHVAAAHGRVKCIRRLVEGGADVNSRDNDGNTPLHIACKKYVKESISLLVELGCNITLMNRLKQTPTQATKYEGARKSLMRSVSRRGW